jgi:hypothetical protein
MPAFFFALIILQIGSHFLPNQLGLRSSYFTLLAAAGTRDVNHRAQTFFAEMGVSQTFYLRLAWNCSRSDFSLPIAWDDKYVALNPAIG